MHALKPLTLVSTRETPRVSYRLSDDGLVTFIGKRRERVVYSIDVTRWTLIQHIPNPDQLKATELLKLAYLSYLYILRLTDTKTIRRLTDVPRDVVTETKNNVFASFELVSFKVATLRCVLQKLTPKNHDQIVANFRACGLRQEDAVLFHLLYHNNDIPEFINHIKMIEDEHVSLCVKSFASELERDPKAFTALERSAGITASTRLAYIARGNRLDITDKQHELLVHAIQVYRWIRPFYPKAHALNYVKRAITNAGHNENTACNKDPYRARTIATADGYDNTHRGLTDEIGWSGDPREQEDTMIEYLDAKRVAYG